MRKRREEETSSLEERTRVERAPSLAKLSMLIRFSRPFSTQLLAVSRCRQSWLDLSRDENGRTRTNQEKQFFFGKRVRKLFLFLFMCVLLSFPHCALTVRLMMISSSQFPRSDPKK